LVLALVGGGNIVGWPQANEAIIVIIILPDTPTLPSIDDHFDHGFVGEHSKVKTAKNVPVHFSKLPRQQPQIPAKSVVDGQAN
jgi:hypothetical protein